MARSKQKGNMAFTILVLIAILIVGGYFVLKSSLNKSVPKQATEQVTSIQNDSDLQQASNGLDNIDIDGNTDSQLNQNDADAATF